MDTFWLLGNTEDAEKVKQEEDQLIKERQDEANKVETSKTKDTNESKQQTPNDDQANSNEENGKVLIEVNVEENKKDEEEAAIDSKTD